MSNHRLPPIDHYEVVVAKQPHAGRPRVVRTVSMSGQKKAGATRSLAPMFVTRDVYLAAANARNPKKAQAFLNRYPLFSAYDGAKQQPRRAVWQDINRFGNIARVILGHMEHQAKSRKKSGATKAKHIPASPPLFDPSLDFLNGELAHCHPIVIPSLYTSDVPTSREAKDFERQVKDIEERFNAQREKYGGMIIVDDPDKAATMRKAWERIGWDQDNTVKNAASEYTYPHISTGIGPRRSGGSFFRIAMRCETSMAACCYYLILDLANEEELRICPQCERLFVAHSKRQAHCDNAQCVKAVARAKRRRSYAKRGK